MKNDDERKFSFDGWMALVVLRMLHGEGERKEMHGEW
jgi:hypothetical protein